MRLNLFRTIACAMLSSLATVLFANDGGFYISGNHLVPISNTTVKVAKEKLTIQLNDNNQTYVDVDFRKKQIRDIQTFTTSRLR